MKTLYTLILLVWSLTTLAAPKITAVQNNGLWNVGLLWNLNRVPANNDTIDIPANTIVVLSTMEILNNVYLRIYGTLLFAGGKLDLSATSSILIFRGGSISGNSNSDQIRIGGVHKYKGGEGVIIGPALANSTTGVAPTGFTAFTLPVKFIGFFVTKTQDAVELSWSTAEEKNNSHFDIQKSVDGLNWQDIAVVFATTTPAPVNQYHFIDRKTVSGTVYYRLKQVDLDGRNMFSVIKSIHTEKPSTLARIFVSSQNTIAVELNENKPGKIIVRVLAVNGQTLYEQTFSQPANRYQIQLTNARPGIYVVQVIKDASETAIQKLVL